MNGVQITRPWAGVRLRGQPEPAGAVELGGRFQRLLPDRLHHPDIQPRQEDRQRAGARARPIAGLFGDDGDAGDAQPAARARARAAQRPRAWRSSSGSPRSPPRSSSRGSPPARRRCSTATAGCCSPRPPLWYYVLREAMVLQGGNQLGPVRRADRRRDLRAHAQAQRRFLPQRRRLRAGAGAERPCRLHRRRTCSISRR